MRKEITIAACFVMAGVLCACLFGYEYFSTYGFLNTYHVRAFTEARLDFATLFCNIVWERGKLMFLIFVFACTPAKRIAPLLLRCALFFTAGIFAGVCMINMGIYGLVVFLLSWFPHGILYLAVIALIMNREMYAGYGEQNRTARKLIFASSVVSLLVLGCFAEATAGTWILKSLFRNLLA